MRSISRSCPVAGGDDEFFHASSAWFCAAVICASGGRQVEQRLESGTRKRVLRRARTSTIPPLPVITTFMGVAAEFLVIEIEHGGLIDATETAAICR